MMKEINLAIVRDEDDYAHVTLDMFWIPEDEYSFHRKRFFAVHSSDMDGWTNGDEIFNDLRSAVAAFGKWANKKYKTGDGKVHKTYGKVEWSDEWKYYMDELLPDCDDCPSSTRGDYGPGNPWDAPGMCVSDFIKGVY